MSREARRHQFTISCKCGGWIARQGIGTDTPPDVEDFIAEHQGHCNCSYPRHAPHLGVVALGKE